MPLYGYNNFLLGTIDCLLLVRIHHQIQITRDADIIEPEEDEIDPYTILCELKPKLNSVSTTLAQIRVYKNKISNMDQIGKKRYHEENSITIHPVIITFDQETKFDKLLSAEGIKVYRIKKE